MGGEGPSAELAIDPRAEAYAKGARSPYEQLRYVSKTWAQHAGLSTKPAPHIKPREPAYRLPVAAGVWAELKGWVMFSAWSFLYVGYVLYFGLKLSSHLYGIPELFDKSGTPSLRTLAIVATGALWGTNVLAMMRAMRRF